MVRKVEKVEIERETLICDICEGVGVTTCLVCGKDLCVSHFQRIEIPYHPIHTTHLGSPPSELHLCITYEGKGCAKKVVDAILKVLKK